MYNESKLGVSPEATNVKQGEVQTQVARLGDSIYELETLISDLVIRLDPVLKPQAIVKDAGDEARLVLSPLAEAVREAQDRVDFQRRRLSYVIEQLAV